MLIRSPRIGWACEVALCSCMQRTGTRHHGCPPLHAPGTSACHAACSHVKSSAVPLSARQTCGGRLHLTLIPNHHDHRDHVCFMCTHNLTSSSTSKSCLTPAKASPVAITASPPCKRENGWACYSVLLSVFTNSRPSHGWGGGSQRRTGYWQSHPMAFPSCSSW